MSYVWRTILENPGVLHVRQVLAKGSAPIGRELTLLCVLCKILQDYILALYQISLELFKLGWESFIPRSRQILVISSSANAAYSLSTPE